jgi:hypothetical protein
VLIACQAGWPWVADMVAVLHGTDWPVFPLDKALAQLRAPAVSG